MKEVEDYHSFSVILFNLMIIGMSFLFFNDVIQGKIKLKKGATFFNITILSFYTTDTIISLASNYLINEHIDLVAPFWMFRAFLFQLIYISIIYFAWQNGKNQKSLQFGSGL
ncbi:hypothetical protein [Aureivirga marina]|uniref:hypothetical protein n=1 Tax=Aureivirga marina TaxID=1182451 RepID=UPI0018C92D60|nr:hypothetical protein [Aureivirga marina]